MKTTKPGRDLTPTTMSMKEFNELRGTWERSEHVGDTGQRFVMMARGEVFQTALLVRNTRTDVAHEAAMRQEIRRHFEQPERTKFWWLTDRWQLPAGA
jgi:hypothetical protein